MRNKILSADHNKQSEEIYYPPLRWYELGSNVLAVDELIRSKKELKQVNQEVQEDDFLLGKTPDILPDNWEEEE